VTAILLAIGSAALWGTADYLGGTSARKLALLVVTGFSQLGGLVTIGALVLLTDAPLSGAGAAWGIAAGLAGAVALSIFYFALAAGAMSLVAPLSACGAVVPVAVAVAQGDDLGPLAVAGMAAALIGIVLIARRDDAALALTPRVIGLAFTAALGSASC
jgi:drug/metabolite transporter (DMT)-like permease